MQFQLVAVLCQLGVVKPFCAANMLHSILRTAVHRETLKGGDTQLREKT